MSVIIQGTPVALMGVVVRTQITGNVARELLP